MALTGFTRNGQCVDLNDDAGSHHVCIDMSSNTGGNFCDVTGQPDWCSSKMPCDGGRGRCPVEHWCVCQWAWEMYVKKEGCENIVDLHCESVNMKALEACAHPQPSQTDESASASLARP